MVVSLVIGNHWRGQHIWDEVEEPHKPKPQTDDAMIQSTRAIPMSVSTGQLDEERDRERGSPPSGHSLLRDKEGDTKGYVMIKGQREPQPHRRSLTMNDVSSSKSVNVNKDESESLVPKLSLTLPDDEKSGPMLPMTKQEKIDNINEFFEELFKSIDYSILLIFMGKYGRIQLYTTGLIAYIH